MQSQVAIRPVLAYAHIFLRTFFKQICVLAYMHMLTYLLDFSCVYMLESVFTLRYAY